MAASKVEIREQLAWKVALCRGCPDAEVALLLALTPNVSELAISLPAPLHLDEYEFFWTALLREATRLNPGRGVHRFRQLTKVYCTSEAGHPRNPHSRGWFRCPLYCIAYFLKLPSLQYLSV